MPAVFERILLVFGVCLPVPLLAATGLSIPMPATVERLAASLVPFAEAATLQANEAPARVSRGVIVRRRGEKTPRVATRSVARRRGAVHSRGIPKPAPRPKRGAPARKSPGRPTVAKTPVVPGARIKTPIERPTEAGASSPQPAQPQPAPQPQPEPQPQPRPQPQPQPEPQPQPQPQPEPQPEPQPLPLPVPLPPPPPLPLPVEVPKLPGLGT